MFRKPQNEAHRTLNLEAFLPTSRPILLCGRAWPFGSAGPVTPPNRDRRMRAETGAEPTEPARLESGQTPAPRILFLGRGHEAGSITQVIEYKQLDGRTCKPNSRQLLRANYSLIRT
jgi:hypothetical protein